MERRDHDRVPRCDIFWPETLERWRGQGMVEAPATIFDFDITRVAHLAPVPFPGRKEVLEQDEHTQVLVNEYGATFRRWKQRSGVPEHLGWECDSADTWRRRFRHRLADPQVDLDACRRSFDAGRRDRRWVCLGSRGVYCFIQTLIGDQMLLESMIDDPDWLCDMAQVVTDAFLAQYTQILDAGMTPDGLWLFDDLAYNRGPFMSPAMYRRIFWPQHRRVIQFAHDHDMKAIFHTDGDVRMLMPDLLATGMDALQPLEAKAGMDVRSLAPSYGDRLSLFGNIDMTVASTNDRDRIEAEVVSKLAAAMPRHGYLYHSDHSVPPPVDWNTYRFIHELLDRYGRYA
jgi:uroporphyrinogen decarboxylase